MLMFCIFTLIVLSNASSNQTESSDIVPTTSRPVDNDSGIMNQPFFECLRSYCYADRKNFVPGARLELPGLYSRLNADAERAKEKAQNFFQNFGLACFNISGHGIFESVTLAELKEMEEGEALKKIHRSVILHSARSFQVYYQLNATREICGHNIQAINDARQVANELSAIACKVFMKMAVSGYEYDDIISQFEPELVLECAKTILYSCHLMKSAETLIQEIKNYAVENLSSVHNSNSTSSNVSFSSISAETTSLYTTLSL